MEMGTMAAIALHLNRLRVHLNVDHSPRSGRNSLAQRAALGSQRPSEWSPVGRDSFVPHAVRTITENEPYPAYS